MNGKFPSTSPPAIETYSRVSKRPFEPAEMNVGEEQANPPWPIEMLPVRSLTPARRNARTHSKKQIQQIAASLQRFGVINPLIADDQGRLVAGHARAEAAKLLGLKFLPVIRLSHLSEAELRAYTLADNKLAEHAGWDRALLAVELGDLIDLAPAEGFDVTVTGFEMGEVDSLLTDMDSGKLEPEDVLPALPAQPVTQNGDLWLIGRHRLLCGDAQLPRNFTRLMNGTLAAAAFLDPPYNLRVSSIGGRGRIRHPEFAFGSGEMQPQQFQRFLSKILANGIRASAEGAIHFVCMDWRHIADLISVGRKLYRDILNLVVWNKSNAGQGSFYRSQHELIGVFRVGERPHKNNIELGRFGRNRSNVWTYAGVNTFGRGRMEALAAHPTVKPTALVADALLDCTARGDAVLDQCAGSGTIFLAAEKVGRVAYGLEIEPRYVDVAIQRWQNLTKLEATLEGDGRSFEEIAQARTKSKDLPGAVQSDSLLVQPPQQRATLRGKSIAGTRAARHDGSEIRRG
jgi:DNA modification methylase